MPTEGFFQRWSRLKTDPAATAADDSLHDEAPPAIPAPVPAVRPAPAAPPGPEDGTPLPQPTLDDVAQLRADSDYSAFVARGVDKSVQRGALKKLFADPHFNIGDGLDLYMGDYNKPDPIPAAMMSALRHTQSFFAQAYPDKQTDDEGAGVLAIDELRASPVTATNPEPTMADTAGTTSATSATSDASGASEDKA